MKTTLFFLFALLFLQAYTQNTVTGYVLDEVSKEPLQGASVFYDGTTIGVVTNTDGYFSISTEKNSTSPLVISYFGYKNKVIKVTDKKNLGNIYLPEEIEQLNEVVLEPDTWSREKKLRIFRNQFLGTTLPAQKCKILNEDDVRLYYSKKEDILYAYANKPIKVQNKFLGYNLEYHLQDFEVRYKTNANGFRLTGSVFYAGTTLFMEIGKKPRRKYIKNRELTYFGSTLHFMRALSAKRLTEEKFRIFKESLEVQPYDYYKIEKIEDGSAKVIQSLERLNILHNRWSNSFIMVTQNPFYIDAHGNHSPVDVVLFGGDMGLLRIANTLPLDYESAN
ncbi:carboxypeptidase-like regulatory domain-containing protein [Cellulophaga omnivescoria]|uniref:carboxypeptidase-like regulatory domain-containing protein n=1 Tax=Cellulophaga omnivescoria TaxID=1888890 RepID=UPI0022F03735|nr:carboxypeptidase-like regulatory domain-containing protein [Cellulophaga omnivescoria]WBU87931.1 carboxypeptidase-like regulatory domain-containing protein [Cellulophaga omnivescoria]